MPSERWSQLRVAFEQAIDLSGEARHDFLEQLGERDEALRTEVDELLFHEAESGGFLDPVGSGRVVEAVQAWPSSSLEGRSIGSYRLERLIAQGGMGAVYEAVQDHPRRRVAVKVMKHGPGSETASQRFRYEVEILARLRHPGIAQVYEAGISRWEETDGRSGEAPFFAMEFVEGGLDILSHARGRELGLEQRLRLMVEVCEAVHHGHQKGVIHRDLKPGNILVEPSGRPKVIDYGIARLVSAGPGAQPTLTEAGQVLGTLQYMSPEQASGDGSEVDTRTDVYSLGVVLYELLTHRPPLPLENLPLLEAARTIHEHTPSRPSSVAPGLDPDLDWIVLRALQKQPGLRYASASELALDIQRFLRGEPALAGPPSATYRIRKFVQRNRIPVFSSAAVVVLMAVSLVVISALYRRSLEQESIATEQRGLAEERTEEAMVASQAAERSAEDAREQQRAAEREAVRARVALEFLEDVLAPETPPPGGRDARLVDLLGPAALDAELRFAGEPEIEATVLHAIARSYLRLGEYPEAEALLHTTRALREGMAGVGEQLERRLTTDLIRAHLNQGRFDEAHALALGVLARCRETLGDEHPSTLHAIHDLGSIELARGRLDEAELLYEDALEARRRVLGDDHLDTLSSMGSTATLYQAQGRAEEAMALVREQVDGLRELGPEGLEDLVNALESLANLHHGGGRLDEAVAIYEDIIVSRERSLGVDHPRTLSSVSNLARLYLGLERYDESEELYRRALRGRREVEGDRAFMTLMEIGNLAKLLYTQERYEEAEPLYLEGLEGLREVVGETHSRTRKYLFDLAKLYQHLGRPEEAERTLLEATEAFRDAVGEGHASTQDLTSDLLVLYGRAERYEEAAPLLLRDLGVRLRAKGLEPPPELSGAEVRAILDELVRHDDEARLPRAGD